MKKLTGRTRFRSAEVVHLGINPTPALVWQVETVHNELTPSGQMVTTVWEWRDGKVEDLCDINSIVYSTINVKVELPVADDELPGETPRAARKLH